MARMAAQHAAKLPPPAPGAPAPHEKPPIHVSLVAMPGTLAMPIAGLYEVLSAFPFVAAFSDDVPARPPFEVEIVGSTVSTLAAASGLPIAVQRSTGDLSRTDIVIVPVMAIDDAWGTARAPELVAWIQRMHECGAIVCSACTGLVVLAETGLLDGLRATTHWAFASRFRERYPNVDLRADEVLVVAGEHDDFVTSGGAASWQDLVLYLISRFVSPAAARAIARFELLERHSEGQSPLRGVLAGTAARRLARAGTATLASRAPCDRESGGRNGAKVGAFVPGARAAVPPRDRAFAARLRSAHPRRSGETTARSVQRPGR